MVDDKIRTMIGGRTSELEGSILGNVLAALLDGEALVAQSSELGKYDGRTIQFELIGPDADPFSAVRVSLVPKS